MGLFFPLDFSINLKIAIKNKLYYFFLSEGIKKETKK